MRIALDDGLIVVTRPSDSGQHRSLHGLTRTLVANMVEGVTTGFEKRLEIVGVGYRASVKGNEPRDPGRLHPPGGLEPPEHIEFETPQPQQILVRGIDKQVVGQVAAEIRAIRQPEPYKGKGIRYEGEYVAKKVGKRA